MLKTCPRCKKELSFGGFYRERRRPDGRSSWCKECVDEKMRRSRRSDRLRLRYGLTVEQYEELLAKQKGVCAICKRPETFVGVGCWKPSKLAVDHDHRCCPGSTSCGKCVRGLLCRKCNLGLAFFEDYPELVPEMERYLNEKTMLAAYLNSRGGAGGVSSDLPSGPDMDNRDSTLHMAIAAT